MSDDEFKKRFDCVGFDRKPLSQLQKIQAISKWLSVRSGKLSISELTVLVDLGAAWVEESRKLR